MLVFVLHAWAQDRTVSGKVTDADTGESLPGVNVLLKGTGTGITTDLDGNYKISVPSDGGVLVFTFIGMETQEVEIGSRSVINVEMATDIAELSEVVVVGYGAQNAKLSTQSVSKVDSKAFENMPILSAQEALQGQAAGVQMTASSGVAGGQQNIRIRGVSSINAGGQPLFVVDGVPMNDGNGIAYGQAQGGATLNPLQELNPNEIESINILKDASATAIYGSRGSNGVIVINTKKGKAGKTKVNLDLYTGVQDINNRRPTMTADQHRGYIADLFGVSQQDVIDAGLATDGSFDWPDAVIQQGSVSNANLSVSGGDEKTQYFFSGTYFQQDAYAIGNEIERLNTRMNILHNITDKLRVGTNIGIAKVNNDRIGADNNTFAPLTSSYLQLPWVEPRTDNGAYVNTGFIANVLAIEELNTNRVVNRRLTGNAFFEYDIIPGLSLKTDFGTDQFQLEENRRDVDIVSPGGYGYYGITQDNKWLNTTTLNFNKTFGENYISAIGGYSYEEANYAQIQVEGSGFLSDDLPNVASAATPTFTSNEKSGWRLNSLFSRVSYRWNDKLLAEGSIRRDGSSRFGAGNRFGIFWAGSLGYVLSEEAFIQDISAISFLKLKASYGTTGNDQIGNFPSLGLYGAGNDYNGVPGIVPTQAANPQLSWEETTQLDITMNLGLFNDRITLEASYYDKLTDGLLLNVPVPYTTGFVSITQNAGEMKNSGFDVLLNTKNFDGDFKWETSFNIGFLNNEITSLPGASVDDEGREFVIGSASQRAIVGHSVNTFYLIRYSGINPETGDAEWLTKDGEVTSTPTAADRVIVGSAIPDFTGGLTNTFSYKGVSLSGQFTFVSGNSVMYDDLRFTDNPNNWGFFNLNPRLLDYWQNPGDDAYAPALTSPTFGTFGQRSTLQLRDASYLRLRNVTLSYTIPKSAVERIGLRSARVYGQAQNLLTLTAANKGEALGGVEKELEPEINGGGGTNLGAGESFFTLPQAKSFTVGVSLGF